MYEEMTWAHHSPWNSLLCGLRAGPFRVQGDNKSYQVSRKKMQMSADKLCQGQSAPFRRFCDAAMGMRFDEEPKYEALIALFEPLVGPAVSRPIAIASESIKVRYRLQSTKT